MRLRTLYGLVGLLWGIPLGLIGWAAVTGFAVGAAWLFVFGDSTWPESSRPVLLGIGIAAGAGTFIGCGALGWAYGRWLERDADPAPARRRGYALGLLAGVAFAALGTLVWLYEDIQRGDRRHAEDLEAGFRALAADSHRITDVRAVVDGGAVTATVTADGSRAGVYRLSWFIHERVYGRLLEEGRETLTLETGPWEMAVEFDLAALRDAFAEGVLSPEARAEVDTELVFEAALEPILGEAEFATIPRREADNLVRGFSDLRATAKTGVKVTFRYP
jgi:hypothetical protein